MSTQAPMYWRSLEELADSQAFKELVQQEFPGLTSILDLPLRRREMLKLMAASFALAGLAGCSQSPEEIVPYVNAPEGMVPGKPLYFATALTLGGYAQGVLVESHMGRPTKVEGNTLHPASLGGTDIFMQAAVLGLYDPDRSQIVTKDGSIRGWDQLLTIWTAKRRVLQTKAGAGLYVLTQTLTSPTAGQQLQGILEAYPNARWHHYEPMGREAAWQGSALAFGEYLDTWYRLDQAHVVVALDADFLSSLPGHVRYARDFIDRRRMRAGATTMNQLYAIESTPGLTGVMADERLVMPAGDVEKLVRALAVSLGLEVADSDLSTLLTTSPQHAHWLNTVAHELQAHPGECVVIAGDHQSPAVHALTQAINERLGNFGKTVIHGGPVEHGPLEQRHSIAELIADINAGKVDTLFILGGNPVYDAPADLDFAKTLAKVPFRVHWGLYADETARHCEWHVPATHEFEAWGDACAFEGTYTIQQPLIAPLYAGRSLHEMLAAIGGTPASGGVLEPKGYEIVRNYWQRWHETAFPGQDFEGFWRQALHDGVVPNAGVSTKIPQVRTDLAANLPAPAVRNGLELQFRPDPTIWDGRFANNGWLQECPKPLTKLVWGNAALISPSTAERHGLANQGWVALKYQGRRMEAPVWLVPGQPDDVITLTLGYGRERAGRVGSQHGVNAYPLRTSDTPWFGWGLTIATLEGKAKDFVTGTQAHHGMEGHEIIHQMTFETFKKSPKVKELQKDSEAKRHPEHRSLYPPFGHGAYAWGMVIDLTACIGCNACVIACQAENNIPIVGKEEVAKSRDMHWLRVDRYYKGESSLPETYFQPVPCMHCELAPCEPVCPVEASVHDDEGINNQVYNRCIGTRTCQANCPYKVRRFNFFDYPKRKETGEGEESIKALRNPDVTVRARGIMEKCTYCIQRINEARYQAQREGRKIRDGEVITACQGACPTRAISFGNTADPNSEVSRLKHQPHNYELLKELNTRPRTTYLACVTNPNAELTKG